MNGNTGKRVSVRKEKLDKIRLSCEQNHYSRGWQELHRVKLSGNTSLLQPQPPVIDKNIERSPKILAVSQLDWLSFQDSMSFGNSDRYKPARFSLECGGNVKAVNVRVVMTVTEVSTLSRLNHSHNQAVFCRKLIKICLQKN